MFKRRWSPTARALLLSSLASAVLAMMLVQGYTKRIDARDPGPLVPVVLAPHAISGGHVLAASDLQEGSMPARYAPAGRIASPAYAVGAVATGPITPGEVITSGRVSHGGPLAALIPSGLRGIVVPSSLPAGTVHEGDRIDILATNTQGAIYTSTVAEQIEVLHVLRPGEQGSSFETTAQEHLALLVDPVTAEQIGNALHTAALTVVVRSASDEGGTVAG